MRIDGGPRIDYEVCEDSIFLGMRLVCMKPGFADNDFKDKELFRRVSKT